MPSGSMNTGAVLEKMILPALHERYRVETQVKAGRRPNGRDHYVDVIATSVSNGKRILVSLKWQQVSGTAEQKVPYEVISLYEALKEGHGDVAYIVLGGDGWSLRDYYVSGEMSKYFKEEVVRSIKIVKLESFVALANKGAL